MKNGTEITPLEPDPDHAGVGKMVTAQRTFWHCVFPLCGHISKPAAGGNVAFYFER